MPSLDSFIDIYGDFLGHLGASIFIIGLILIFAGIGSGLYHWAKRNTSY